MFNTICLSGGGISGFLQLSCLKTLIDSDKKFCIIEAGTGVGKSAIGLTIANFINENSSSFEGKYEDGSYFLTTQKVLQDQYEKDFSKMGMKSLKSSSNYMCKYKKRKKSRKHITYIILRSIICDSNT